MGHICKKCSKVLSTKYTLKTHEEKCKDTIYTIYNKCAECNNFFSTKQNLLRHIANGCKKNILLNKDDNNINNDNIKNSNDINNKNDKYKCQNCKKTYASNYSLKRHVVNCNNKLEILENKLMNTINNQQSLLINELKKLLYEKNINITNNNNSIVNNGNMQINNYNLYSMGNEDLSNLTDEEKLKICTSGTFYPIVATELIQCNEKYPQFQNVLITDMNSDSGFAYINNQWVKKSGDEIITKMMEVNKNHTSKLISNINIDEKYKIKYENTKFEIDNDENKEHLKDKIKNKLSKASEMIIKNKEKKEESKLDLLENLKIFN